MSFQGSGTGFVSYVIADQPTVNNPSCTLTVLEDDDAGMLTLNVSFTDNTYGQVQIGISVFSYSPSTTTYNNVGYLMIGFFCETPQGGWVSNAESSVFLQVSQQAGANGTTYSGSFNSDNLTWIGIGNENSLLIKFGSYSFTVTNTLTPGDINSGEGTGSVTYTIGSAAQLTEQASASTMTYYNDGVLYGLHATVIWNDPTQGQMTLVVNVFPFSGSGTYVASPQTAGPIMTLSSADAGTGTWNNYDNTPQVTLQITYSEDGNSAPFGGSLQATGLTWQGIGSQANLNIDLSAFSFNLNLG